MKATLYYVDFNILALFVFLSVWFLNVRLIG